MVWARKEHQERSFGRDQVAGLAYWLATLMSEAGRVGESTISGYWCACCLVVASAAVLYAHVCVHVCCAVAYSMVPVWCRVLQMKFVNQLLMDLPSR